jgi:hypothetical protein
MVKEDLMNFNDQENYMAGMKPVEKSIINGCKTSGRFYHYEPGNGTRYEVFISDRLGNDIPDYYPGTVISVMNFDRPCSMTIPVFDGKPDVHPDYMMEKMRIGLGDALALVKLVHYHFENAL